MRKDEILNMPAGREMDELIGRIVYPDAKEFLILQKYSTYIDAAWDVVEKMKTHNPNERSVEITFYHGLWHVDFGQSIHTEVFDKSIPLAICRAALLVVNNA